MHGMHGQGHGCCCHHHCCGGHGEQAEAPMTKEQKRAKIARWREKLEHKLAMLKEKEAELDEE